MRERFVNLCDKNEAASYQLILIRAGNCCFPEFSDLSVTVRQADEACHRIPTPRDRARSRHAKYKHHGVRVGGIGKFSS